MSHPPSVPALTLLVAAHLIGLAPLARAAQSPAQDTTLEVRVEDETRARLVHATVAVTSADGAEQVEGVDGAGVARFTGLQPGAYHVSASAEGFRTLALPLTVRAGVNEVTLRLAVAIAEEIFVSEPDASERRDGGFSSTLTQEEIDALSDDPDEMADQLAQIAGEGAEIFVDGFRGGRLPPKDQIQQIRFRRNSFSAEYHGAGRTRVEVITRPGAAGWRGRFNVGFRDESLNARNAFAPRRGAEQQQRYSFNFSGPLERGRTTVSFSADGLTAYDSETILAATPAGDVSGLVRQPTDRISASVRLDHAFSDTGQLRLGYDRRTSDRNNLGVGNTDLWERAYEEDERSDALRARLTGIVGGKMFGELRAEWRGREETLSSFSAAPAIRVLDAFTSGGAGREGSRRSHDVEIAQNVDLGVGRHTLRAGAIFEGTWSTSTEQTNANGTFTFVSLADFLAGNAAQFSRRVGDPRVAYSHQQAGWYVQDDIRISRELSIGVGLRHEFQSHLADAWNFAPRVGFTWSPRDTRLDIRGGYGIFYDWLDTGLYEQTIRLDGTHQLEEILLDPTYPVPGGGVSEVVPPSVIRTSGSLSMPTIQQLSLGVERPLTGWLNARADFLMLRGTNQFRSVNANTPIDGVRPDPRFRNVSLLSSTGRSAVDRLSVGLIGRVPRLRLMGNLRYQFSSSRDHANSALALPSDSTNPDVDWGPAADDVRHRVFAMLTTPVLFGVRAHVMAQGSSGRPYTITTGRDDNGDTVFNDRPAGVGRNSVRGSAVWDVNLRLTRVFSLGGAAAGGGGPIATESLSQRGRGGRPGGQDGPVAMLVENAESRYRFELFAQISNLLNRTNYTSFVGNQLSPFFGMPTSALPPRRIELGASFRF